MIREYIHVGNRGKDYILKCLEGMYITNIQDIDGIIKSASPYIDDFCIRIEGSYLNYCDKQWYDKNGYKEKIMNTSGTSAYVPQTFDLVKFTNKYHAGRLGWIIISNQQIYIQFIDCHGYDLFSCCNIIWAKRPNIKHFLHNDHLEHDDYPQVYPVTSKEVKLNDQYTARVFKDKIEVGCQEFSIENVKELIKTSESLQ